MAKQILSSKDLTEKLMQADSSIEAIKNGVEDIQRDLSQKLSIIHNEETFAARKLEELALYVQGSNHLVNSRKEKVVFGLDVPENEHFELFGGTIHPEFLRVPRNLFNLTSRTGPLFRGNVVTYLNGEVNTSLKMALMQEGAAGKEPFFIESETDEVSIIIELDRSVLLGDSHFNMIEIIPYLEGSFDIKSLDIREITSPGVISKTVTDVKDIAKSRFLFDKKYELFSIELIVKLNYQNESGLYPFGLHSLQFLNADFVAGSHAICKISRTEYIEYVGNNIVVQTNEGASETTMLDEGIQAYIGYANGVLSGEIQISTDDVIYPIARNAKDIFLKIPLSKSIKSIALLELETRQ